MINKICQSPNKYSASICDLYGELCIYLHFWHLYLYTSVGNILIMENRGVDSAVEMVL